MEEGGRHQQIGINREPLHCRKGLNACGCHPRCISTDVLSMWTGDGGVEFCRGARVAGLEGCLSLHYLPALRLWGGPALPHDSRMQREAEAVAPGRPSDKEMQVVGADLAERNGMGARGRLMGRS